MNTFCIDLQYTAFAFCTFTSTSTSLLVSDWYQNVYGWWSSCWWSETTSLNCGHQQVYLGFQQACCLSRKWWAWIEPWWNDIDRGTPDSLITAHWQSCQQSHVVAKQEEILKEMMTYKVSLSTLWRVLRHAIKSCNMGLTALLPMWRKACCRCLSPLKILCPQPGLNLGHEHKTF
jgi:hypothetical protein